MQCNFNYRLKNWNSITFFIYQYTIRVINKLRKICNRAFSFFSRANEFVANAANNFFFRFTNQSHCCHICIHNCMGFRINNYYSGRYPVEDETQIGFAFSYSFFRLLMNSNISNCTYITNYFIIIPFRYGISSNPNYIPIRSQKAIFSFRRFLQLKIRFPFSFQLFPVIRMHCLKPSKTNGFFIRQAR